MRATNQGGSLAGFIIVGVLLALVLVGGLYGLNRYNAEKAGEEVATEEQAGTEKNETDAAGDRQRTSTDETPAPKPAATSGTPATDPGDATPAATPPANAQLPATGPADTFYAVFVISLLAFVSVHYVRSRTSRA